MAIVTSIYTDGSSTGRSNKEWGWAFVVVENDKVITFNYGGGESGTNQTAELTGAIQGLCWAAINKKKEIILVSDSQYVLNIANGQFNPKKNLELAKELQYLYNELKPELKWIKGHNGSKWNELADYLSKKGKELYK